MPVVTRMNTSLTKEEPMTSEDETRNDRTSWLNGKAAANWPTTLLGDFFDESECVEVNSLALLRNVLSRTDEADALTSNAELMEAFCNVYGDGFVAHIDAVNIGEFAEAARAEVKDWLVALAARAIDRLLLAAVRSCREFTASQIYRALPPELHFRGQIGSAISAADRAGFIEVNGLARAGFPAESGRPAILWAAN